MNTRLQGGPSSPLGRPRATRAELGDVAGAAVGFNAVTDASQGPSHQAPLFGTVLSSPTQRKIQIAIGASTPQSFGYILLPEYVGWVTLYPRVRLPNTDPIPADAFPTRVGYFNAAPSLPPPPANPLDSAAVVEWVKSYGTPFHTHFGVTLESTSELIYGTPFSELSPVFLPTGINIAVFQGQLDTVAWADASYCTLTVIASPINEALMLPGAMKAASS